LNESSEDICTDLQEELKDFEVPIVKLNVDIKKTTDIENHIFYGIMGFWAGMTVTMLFLIWII
jgi:hypothetical protein